MNPAMRDRFVGLTLLVVALIWSGLVYELIPTGDDSAGAIGPRAFPFLLGLILVALSAIMVVRSFVADDPRRPAAMKPDHPQVSGLEVRMAGGIFLAILLYGYFMERLGFRLATFIMTAAMLTLMLKVRRPVLVLLYSVCVSIGCWVIFNKLLGAYLPTGSWTSLG